MRSVLLLLLAAGLHAQTLITVTGPVNRSNGTGWTGKILLSNPDMICGSITVPAGSQVLTVTGGVLSATIYATADCLPAGSSYLAEYSSSDLSLPSRWAIGTSPTTIAVSAIQSAGTARPDIAISLSRLGFGSVADGEFIRRVGNNWVGAVTLGGSFGTLTGAPTDNPALSAALAGKEPADAAIVKTSGTYLNPAWITGLPFSRITGITGTPSGAKFLRDDGSWNTVPIVGSTTDLPEGANLYFTDLRARGALVVSGTAAPATTPPALGMTYVETTTPLVYTSICTTSSACWQNIASAASMANAAVSFTAQTSVTIPHNYNSTAVIADCQDASGKRVFGAFDYSDPNNTVVTFAVAQSGRCKANATGGGGGGGGVGVPESTTVANTGAGAQVLKTGTNVTARTVVAGANVIVTQNADTIEIAATGGGGGGGGTTYTAGTGLNLSGTTFSLDGAATALVNCQSVTPPAWSSIASGRSQTQTVAAVGFLDGDAVFIGANNTLAAGLFALARGGADTVDVTIINMTAGALTPATLPFKVCWARHF